MSDGTPCPRCGGSDRFVALPQTDKYPAMRWCRQCHYTERTTTDDGNHAPQIIRTLSSEEMHLAQHGYRAVAEWCSLLLFTPGGSAALDYLRRRGFSDNTLRAARIGYHPEGQLAQQVGAALWATDRDAYEGARLGGLLGPQGRPKSLLRRSSITIPYLHQDGCTLIRARRLDASDGAKYLSPSGVGLYLGGTPTLYLIDSIQDANTVILTEGEFKALLSWQHGVAAVAQPGIGYLPDSYLEQLAGKTVVICYDREKRTDPFVLSPGERFSIRAVERMTGIMLLRQLERLSLQLESIKKKKDYDHQDQYRLEAQIEQAKSKLEWLRALNIRVRVLRLPREPDEEKVDLDGFIQAHGADELKRLLAHASDAWRWHEQHSGGEYSYERGGIYNGAQVANYQARIMETVYQNDGRETTTVQRFALRTPSGRRTMVDIPMDAWADDRQARHAVRVGLGEGTFDDNPREILRAIRILSNQGDSPVEREVFISTGWEQINGRWHLLASDGAVNATGVTTAIRAELDSEISGNHYALCGDGDAAAGADAWIQLFLGGQVCPQPIALILAGHVALPLIHRFTGNAARPMTWLYHQTGAMKTSLIRASCMALYGPHFTAEMSDGAPVPKWDATSVGLGYLVYYYRDMPLLIDDYKMGVINPSEFKRFLHNYSEGTGRVRGHKRRQLDRVFPARNIIFSTAEDKPDGDPGMFARLLPMQLKPDSVSGPELARLQRAGADGHLAAFWRGFVQQIAGGLDAHGEKGIKNKLTELIRMDDAAIPGHKRTQGTLRQNRMAFLLLTSWLLSAGHIDQAQHDDLNAAHLEARNILASVLEQRQHESRASSIFLSVLSELIDGGEYVIEQPDMNCPRCGNLLRRSSDGWYCEGVVGAKELPCSYHLPASRIMGFLCEDGNIGLHLNKSYQAVARIRRDQGQPLAYTSTAIWQQMDADGYIAQKHKSGSYSVQRRNTCTATDGGRGAISSVLLITPAALGWGETETNCDLGVKNTMTGHDRCDTRHTGASNGTQNDHDRGMTGHDRGTNDHDRGAHGKSPVMTGHAPVMIDHDRGIAHTDAPNPHNPKTPVMIDHDRENPDTGASNGAQKAPGHGILPESKDQKHVLPPKYQTGEYQSTMYGYTFTIEKKLHGFFAYYQGRTAGRRDTEEQAIQATAQYCGVAHE